MGLANFLDKVSLSAAQILSGFDRSIFETILENHRLLVFFDRNAVTTTEGKATLDLVIRLVARIYPNIHISSIECPTAVAALEKIALSINPEINLSHDVEPTICVVVGQTPYLSSQPVRIPIFYIGSDNWNAKLSLETPQGSVNSNNPIAAGAAACFGAANVFREVFKAQLAFSAIDDDFTLSLFDFTLNPNSSGPSIQPIDLGEVLIVGAGAIGNSALWALEKMADLLSGKLVVVDNESVELTNLQRYVLANQESIDRLKVDIIAEIFGERKLKVFPIIMTWEEYVQDRQDYQIETVAVCVDTAKDRIMVQGSLPKMVFNAWTQQENLGVSRHPNFAKNPCLCCLYIPRERQKSYSEEIAIALSLPEPEVRFYLANNVPMDQDILHRIATANGIPECELSAFLGKHIQIFYSNAICSGVLMKLQGKSSIPRVQQIEVPSAFESALAGILLTSEILIEKAGFRQVALPTTTQFNLIRALTPYLSFEESKRDNCICLDETFLNVYTSKWG